MNWQTLDLFQEAREMLDDDQGEDVFSPDQVAILVRVICKLEEAVAKEIDCLPSHNYSPL